MGFESGLLAISVILGLVQTPAHASELDFFSDVSCSAKATGETQVDKVDNIRANKAKLRVEKVVQKLGIDKDKTDALVEAYQKNTAIEEAVDSIGKDTASDVREINKLRLEIMILLGDINPNDPEQMRNAELNPDVDGKTLDLMTVVIQAQPGPKSPKAKKNFALFLRLVKDALSSGQNFHEVLGIVQETLEMKHGIEIDIHNIQTASRGPGVMELFASEEDAKELKIGGANGKAALEVRMSKQKAQQLSIEAASKAAELVDLAKDPSLAAERLTSDALKSLQAEMQKPNAYLENNHLLDVKDRKAAANPAIEEQQKVAGSIDEL
ncbi:MAG: hypothetical protein K2X47_11475, partial [Bdellovibrionales bacterium]|nr:hypothetical protein [Bdellovibrionales bacterium]